MIYQQQIVLMNYWYFNPIINYFTCSFYAIYAYVFIKKLPWQHREPELDHQFWSSQREPQKYELHTFVLFFSTFFVKLFIMICFCNQIFVC